MKKKKNEDSDVFIKGLSICKVQALFRIDNRGEFLHSRCLDLTEKCPFNLLTGVKK